MRASLRRTCVVTVMVGLIAAGCGDSSDGRAQDADTAPSSVESSSPAPSSPSPSPSPSTARRHIEASGPSYRDLEDASTRSTSAGAIRATVLRQIRTTDRLDPVQEDSPALEYDLWEVRVDEAPGADATPRSLVVAQVANTANQSHSGPGPRLQEGARGVLVLGTAMSDEWVHPEFGWVYYPVAFYGEEGKGQLRDRATERLAAASPQGKTVDEVLREANQGVTFHASTMTD